MITYVPHAKDQMSKRGISTADVEDALSNFHTTMEGNKPDRTLYTADVRGGLLVVVATTRSYGYHVITAYFR